MDTSYIILFKLLRAALNDTCKEDSMPTEINWERVFELASKHGVAPIAWDGLNKLYKQKILSPNILPNSKTKLKWIASVLYTERNQKKQEEVLKSIDLLLEQNNTKILLFKGLSVGLYYPIPSHRYCCDIDVFALDGNLKKLESCIVSEGGKLGDRNRKHSTIDYQSVHLELHNSFVYRSCSKKIARINNELVHKLKDAEKLLDFKNIYHPSLEFETLFVLLHAANHYKTEGIAVRHIIDFALLVKNQKYKWDDEWLKQNNLLDFAKLLNKFAKDFLGFDIPKELYECNKVVYNRILNDILGNTVGNGNYSLSKIGLLRKKFNRFTSRKWVYPILGDNFWYATLGTIINHIIEPVSIFRGHK